MDVVRMKLTPDDISPANLRTSPSTGVMQFSPDGGETWVDAPGFDPRYSDVYRMPPLTGDVRCDVAARIVAQWQETLELFYNTTSIVEGTTALLALIVGLITGGAAGLLFAIVVAVLQGLVTIGKIAIAAAFTTEVWDVITCIVYCNISTDGQVSAAQRDTIMSEIAAAYPGTVAGTLAQLNNLYGEVLLSNAGVVRTETGDCEGCECGCGGWWIDFSDAGKYSLVVPTKNVGSCGSGTLDSSFGNPLPSGQAAQGTDNASMPGMWVAVEADFGAAHDVESVDFDFWYNRSDAAVLGIYIQYFLSGVQVGETDTSHSGDMDVWSHYSGDGTTRTCDRVIVTIYGSGGGFTGDCWIDNICIAYP